jgi:hypothetical protein
LLAIHSFIKRKNEKNNKDKDDPLNDRYSNRASHTPATNYYTDLSGKHSIWFAWIVIVALGQDKSFSFIEDRHSLFDDSSKSFQQQQVLQVFHAFISTETRRM